MTFSDIDQWLLGGQPLTAFFLVGLIGALLIRSWWSLLVVPAVVPVALFAMLALFGDPGAALDRLDGSISTVLGLWFLVVTVPIVLGVTVGSIIVKQVFGAREW